MEQYNPIWLIPIGPRPLTEKEMLENAKRESARILEAVKLYREQQEKVMVRAKFALVGIYANYGTGRTLTFEPRYDETIPEDKRFALATPTGKFEMYCDNPKALEQLELGNQYYFDITPAE